MLYNGWYLLSRTLHRLASPVVQGLGGKVKKAVALMVKQEPRSPAVRVQANAL
jgi:hypothetical protein